MQATVVKRTNILYHLAMPALKIGIALTVIILAITLFSVSAGGITLFILRRKAPDRNLASIKDDFSHRANAVFGNTLIQHLVIRCILWGMSIVIFFVNLLVRLMRRVH